MDDLAAATDALDLDEAEVRRLADVHGISTASELELACRTHRLRDLPDFGPETQQRLLSALVRGAGWGDRRLLDAARRAAVRVIERLGRDEEAIRLSVAGSVRRMAPTHERVDLLATAHDTGRLLDAFEGLPFVAERLYRGGDHGVVRLDEGPVVRLDVTTEARFAAQLVARTGPPSHVRRLETMGLDLGVFEGADEEGLYASVGLPFVPPERRESDDLEVPEDLVSMADVRGVVGLHTDAGAGAFGAGRMLERAAREGYAWAVLADRCPSVEGIEHQRREARELEPTLPEGFRVLVGGVLDVRPGGSLDGSDAALERLDLVIAAPRAATTESVLSALDDPRVDALAFPFGDVLLGKAGARIDEDAVLDRCAGRGVAVAWSGLPHRLTLTPGWHEAARSRGLRALPLADAHDLQGIDQAIYAVGQARRGGWRRGQILTTRDADAILERRR